MTDLKSGGKFPLLLSEVLEKKPYKSSLPLKKHFSRQLKNLDVVSDIETQSFLQPLYYNKKKTVRSNILLDHSSGGLALTSAFIRKKMVERIAYSKKIPSSILNAMNVVPRHLFVDTALAAKAYEEIALPIGASQTISRPSVIASMLSYLIGERKLPLRKVLEIGTGCAYQAALLSFLAKDVYSIERIKYLHERAKRNLRYIFRPNIRLLYGDGTVGLPEVSPFDGIIVAAAGLNLSSLLMDQIAVGGRLIAPIGNRNQRLVMVERITVKRWKEVFLDKVNFVPLIKGIS